MEKPLANKQNLQLEQFNEVVVFLCGLHSLYFILDSEDSLFSVTLIVLLVVLVLVNMVVIFGNLVRD